MYQPDAHQGGSSVQVIAWLDYVVLIPIFLFVFTLHGSALHGYWRWDDGTHLYDAVRYPAISFFLDPEVMRTVSGNQIAPWNVFIYWINLGLFGFAPAGYYLHHLLSLAGAAGALFLLLRQWVDREHAVVPALLLVIGAPTFQMAQQLMVGHYLDGLTFSCLSIWAQVHAVRSDRGRWTVMSAVLYLLACLCKEVYVPCVALLALVTIPSFMNSWRYAIPSTIVALCYVGFRVLLFAGVGGYHVAPHSLLQPLQGIAQILPSLIGRDFLGIVASCACSLAIVLGIAARRPSQRILVAAALVIVVIGCVFPLVFVATPGTDWNESARYLWMPWVGLIVLWCLPWSQPLRHWRYLAVSLFVLAAGQQSVHQRLRDGPVEALFDAHYRFVLEPSEGFSLLPVEINGPGYLMGVAFAARMARHLRNPSETQVPVLVVHNMPTNSAQISNIRIWQDQCRCMMPLDSLPVQEQHAALQVQMRNLVLALPLDGVMPRVAGAYGGAIDHVQVQGKRLHISGWTPTAGEGRMLVITGFTDPATAHIETIRRLDMVDPSSPEDMDLAGFHATLTFLDEAASLHASQNFCALVHGNLPGQEHTFLLLPLPNSHRCDLVLAPQAKL